jgi:Flp pilus assembly pilin Flp
MLTKLNNAFRAVREDERGTGLVELAMIAPMLAVLAVGIVDLTQGFNRRMELHDAVHRTLEKVAARRFRVLLSDGEVDTVFMQADAADAAGVPTEAVSVDTWLECDGVEQDSFTADCPALSNPPPDCSLPAPPTTLKCAADTARYVRIRIDSFYTPTIGKFVSRNSDGTVPLSAEGSVRLQ